MSDGTVGIKVVLVGAISFSCLTLLPIVANVRSFLVTIPVIIACLFHKLAKGKV